MKAGTRWYTIRLRDRHLSKHVEVQRNRPMTGVEVLRDLTIAAEHGCFDVLTLHDADTGKFIAGWDERKYAMSRNASIARV